MTNSKLTDLALTENCFVDDDEYSNPKSSTELNKKNLVVDDDDDDDDDDDPPNCVLKVKISSDERAAKIRRRLHRRFEGVIVKCTIDVEKNTVAIYGDVNPHEIQMKLSKYAARTAKLVFYKEDPNRRKPEDDLDHNCETCDFNLPFCNEVVLPKITKKLLQTKGINSIIVYAHGVVISIYGDDHLDPPTLQETLRNLFNYNYNSRYSRYFKLLSHKRKNDVIQNDRAAKDANSFHSEDSRALLSIEKNHNVEGLGFLDTSGGRAIISDSSSKIFSIFKVEADINCDWGEDGYAAKVNQKLLSINGVQFVSTCLWEDSAFVQVYGDVHVDRVTIMKTISKVWKRAELVSYKLKKVKLVAQVPFWSRYRVLQRLISFVGRSL